MWKLNILYYLVYTAYVYLHVITQKSLDIIYFWLLVSIDSGG